MKSNSKQHKSQFYTVLLLTLSLVLTGCSKHTENPVKASVARPEITEISPDTEISFEKTAAESGLGYKVLISADGALIFKITYFTDPSKIKDTQARLSREQMLSLLNEFQKADFSAFNDSYSGRECPKYMTDSPTVILSLRVNGQKKTTVHDGGCRDQEGSDYPKTLTALEKKIEEIINTKQWFPK